MNLSSFREKEVAIVVIVSIFIISIVTLFYSTYDVQRDVRESLFEQQKDRQLSQVELIANNIRSDSQLALSHLRGLANSLYLQNGDLSGNATENLLKDTYNEVNGIGDRLFVIDNKNIVRLNIVPQGENSFIGTDMSSIDWVTEARAKLAPMFSKEVVGLDGKHSQKKCRNSLITMQMRTNFTDKYLAKEYHRMQYTILVVARDSILATQL